MKWVPKAGDKVRWNDPDEGVCSRILTIKKFEWIPERGDDMCWVVAEENWSAELFISELELVEE